MPLISHRKRYNQPRLDKKKLKQITTMRFAPELLDDLDMMARFEGRTRSNLITHILVRATKAHRRERKLQEKKDNDLLAIRPPPSIMD